MISPLNNSLTFAADVLAAELEAIKAESLGWLPFGHGAYLHHGDSQATHDNMVIQVVGIPEAGMVGMNVLLLS
jgi:hypothetical protein